MVKGKKETRWLITFAFESKEDQQEVLKEMKKMKSITWFNDSKEAKLTSSKIGKFIINVGKSWQNFKD